MTEFIAGHLEPAEHRLDPSVVEHGVEQAGELSVAVADQEPRPAAGVLEIRDEVPRDLYDPARSGMRGCTQDPGGMLNDCQHIQAGPG